MYSASNMMHSRNAGSMLGRRSQTVRQHLTNIGGRAAFVGNVGRTLTITR